MVVNHLAAAIPNEMTRETIAKQSGISRVYLQQLIAGDKTPSIDVALRLSVTLHKPIDILFQLVDAARPRLRRFRRTTQIGEGAQR
jgi:transcriptional regulator with XRE-family HTH domain